MTHAEYADGLRRIADWYEEHPTAPLPLHHTLDVFPGGTREDMAAIARLLAPCDKRAENDLFYLSRRFGAVTLQFIRGQENICTGRVVGTRVIPARPAEPEREVEMVEWDCKPILSHDEGGEA